MIKNTSRRGSAAAATSAGADCSIEENDNYSKFQLTPGAFVGKFGSTSDFMSGVESLLGPPNPNVIAAIRNEHLHGADSFDPFTPSPNMSVQYFPSQEFEFVVGPDPAVEYPGLKGPENGTAASGGRRSIKQLSDFFSCSEFMDADLTAAEVIALRLYTGPMFYKYNAVLRHFPVQAVQRLKGNRYVTTLHCIISGIVKLSHIMVLPNDRRVYRGLGGMLMPEQFWKKDQFGCRGGVEYGMLSTTKDQSVALEYSGSFDGNHPTLFEIELGQVNRGASLKWLSQYPAEDEILIPPFSNLEVVGESHVKKLPLLKGSNGDNAATTSVEILTIPLRLTVNMRSKTIGEVIANRKLLHLATLETLLEATKRELEDVIIFEPENNAENSGTQGTSDVQALVSAACVDFETHIRNKIMNAAPEKFNDDFYFRTAQSDMMDLKVGTVAKQRVIAMAQRLLGGKGLRAMMDSLQQNQQQEAGAAAAGGGSTGTEVDTLREKDSAQLRQRTVSRCNSVLFADAKEDTEAEKTESFRQKCIVEMKIGERVRHRELRAITTLRERLSAEIRSKRRTFCTTGESPLTAAVLLGIDDLFLSLDSDETEDFYLFQPTGRIVLESCRKDPTSLDVSSSAKQVNPFDDIIESFSNPLDEEVSDNSVRRCSRRQSISAATRSVVKQTSESIDCIGWFGEHGPESERRSRYYRSLLGHCLSKVDCTYKYYQNNVKSSSSSSMSSADGTNSPADAVHQQSTLPLLLPMSYVERLTALLAQQIEEVSADAPWVEKLQALIQTFHSDTLSAANYESSSSSSSSLPPSPPPPSTHTATTEASPPATLPFQQYSSSSSYPHCSVAADKQVLTMCAQLQLACGAFLLLQKNQTFCVIRILERRLQYDLPVIPATMSSGGTAAAAVAGTADGSGGDSFVVAAAAAAVAGRSVSRGTVENVVLSVLQNIPTQECANLQLMTRLEKCIYLIACVASDESIPWFSAFDTKAVLHVVPDLPDLTFARTIFRWTSQKSDDEAEKERKMNVISGMYGFVSTSLMGAVRSTRRLLQSMLDEMRYCKEALFLNDNEGRNASVCRLMELASFGFGLHHLQKETKTETIVSFSGVMKAMNNVKIDDTRLGFGGRTARNSLSALQLLNETLQLGILCPFTEKLGPYSARSMIAPDSDYAIVPTATVELDTALLVSLLIGTMSPTKVMPYGMHSDSTVSGGKRAVTIALSMADYTPKENNPSVINFSLPGVTIDHLDILSLIARLPPGLDPMLQRLHDATTLQFSHNPDLLMEGASPSSLQNLTTCMGLLVNINTVLFSDCGIQKTGYYRCLSSDLASLATSSATNAATASAFSVPPSSPSVTHLDISSNTASVEKGSPQPWPHHAVAEILYNHCSSLKTLNMSNMYLDSLKFGSALRDYPYLSVSNPQLNSFVLVKLQLDWNRIGALGLGILCTSVLSRCPQLQHLSLSDCRLCQPLRIDSRRRSKRIAGLQERAGDDVRPTAGADSESIAVISDLINSHRSVQETEHDKDDSDDNDGSGDEQDKQAAVDYSGVRLLASTLVNSLHALTTLDVSHNALGDEGLLAMTEALVKCAHSASITSLAVPKCIPSLRTLKTSHNDITPAGSAAFNDLFRIFSSLTNLDLSGNPRFTTEGAALLSRVLDRSRLSTGSAEPAPVPEVLPAAAAAATNAQCSLDAPSSGFGDLRVGDGESENYAILTSLDMGMNAMDTVGMQLLLRSLSSQTRYSTNTTCEKNRGSRNSADGNRSRVCEVHVSLNSHWLDPMPQQLLPSSELAVEVAAEVAAECKDDEVVRELDGRLVTVEANIAAARAEKENIESMMKELSMICSGTSCASNSSSSSSNSKDTGSDMQVELHLHVSSPKDLSSFDKEDLYTCPPFGSREAVLDFLMSLPNVKSLAVPSNSSAYFLDDGRRTRSPSLQGPLRCKISPCLEEINFNLQGLGDTFICKMVDAIMELGPRGLKLKRLNLKFNKLSSVSGTTLSRLFQPTATGFNLESLEVEGNMLENGGVEALVEAVVNSKHLTHLGIARNKITRPGTPYLCAIAAGSTSLRTLDLMFSNADLIELASAIKQSAVLEYVFLDDRFDIGTTVGGAEALIDAFRVSKSLKACPGGTGKPREHEY